MTTRRKFILLAAALPLAALAGAPSRYRMVVRLPWREGAEEHIGFDHIGAKLAEALAAFGYVEGRNLEVVQQHAVGDKAAFEAQLVKIRSGPVHALFVFGVKAALAWQERIPDAPIVAWGVMDPVASGLAKTFLRPGGRITGLTQGVPALAGKQVDFLRQIVPGLEGVAIFSGVREDAILDYQLELKAFEDAVVASGLRVWNLRDAGPRAAESLSTLRRRGVQAAIYVSNPTSGNSGLMGDPEGSRTHAEAAIRARVAIAGRDRHLVDRGFLVGYDEHPRDFYMRAAQQVDRVFRSGSAADLPFINPSRFEMHLNLQTAAALGLSVPDSIRLRADRLVT